LSVSSLPEITWAPSKITFLGPDILSIAVGSLKTLGPGVDEISTQKGKQWAKCENWDWKE
jgi:hypothetical protein